MKKVQCHNLLCSFTEVDMLRISYYTAIETHLEYVEINIKLKLHIEIYTLIWLVREWPLQIPGRLN